MSTALDLVPKNPRSDGTGSNPRCLRRDVNRNAAMGATADRAFSLINDNKGMDGFYNQLLGMPIPKNDSFPWGVSLPRLYYKSRTEKAEADHQLGQIHTAGHYVAAVDPGGDAMTSPGDPIFYFHHAALDRLWWIWQMQDPDKRLNAIPTGTMPPMRRTRRADPTNRTVDMAVSSSFYIQP